jgi:hypothetical protein
MKYQMPSQVGTGWRYGVSAAFMSTITGVTQEGTPRQERPSRCNPRDYPFSNVGKNSKTGLITKRTKRKKEESPHEKDEKSTSKEKLHEKDHFGQESYYQAFSKKGYRQGRYQESYCEN